jgi:hypothetical protein
MSDEERYELGPDIDLDVEVVTDRTGRRITEARAEQIAAETLQKVGRGRPSLAGRRGRSPQITFRLPPELRAKAERRAARDGKRVSDVAREALERHLAS